MKYLMIAILSIALSGCAGLGRTEIKRGPDYKAMKDLCKGNHVKSAKHEDSEVTAIVSCNHDVFITMRPQSPQLYNQQ